MKTLTDDELNVAILEWLGWVWMERKGDSSAVYLFPKEPATWIADGGSLMTERVAGEFRQCARPLELDVDPYGAIWDNHVTGDRALGNLHEAEKKLSPEQALQYEREIAHIIWQNDKDEYWKNKGKDIRTMCLHADSLTRATALVKVIKPELFK